MDYSLLLEMLTVIKERFSILVNSSDCLSMGYVDQLYTVFNINHMRYMTPIFYQVTHKVLSPYSC